MKLHQIISLIFLSLQLTTNLSGTSTPKISAITSMYKSKKYLEHFLQEIVKQTIFDQCELIIINANSPDTEFEEPLIFEYQTKFPNIIYIKLKFDPGIYGVWNLGIKLARADYITNANVDDRLAYNCYEILARALDENLDVDLVYSDKYQTDEPNHSFCDFADKPYQRAPEFSIRTMLYCLPGPFPMWRKSFHTAYGFFDETFKSCGDLDLWLKAVMQGAVFKKINRPLGVFFNQTDRKSRHSAEQEQEEIKKNQILFRQLLEQNTKQKGTL